MEIEIQNKVVCLKKFVLFFKHRNKLRKRQAKRLEMCTNFFGKKDEAKCKKMIDVNDLM